MVTAKLWAGCNSIFALLCAAMAATGNSVTLQAARRPDHKLNREDAKIAKFLISLRVLRPFAVYFCLD